MNFNYLSILSQNGQSSNHSTPLVAKFVLAAVTLAAPSVDMRIAMPTLNISAIATTCGAVYQVSGFEPEETSRPDSILKIYSRIDELSLDVTRLEDDEELPLPSVISEIKNILGLVDKLLPEGIPNGLASVFYGEVNIMWQADGRIVRLACFPNGPSRVQTGSIVGPLGTYRSELEATPEFLANALNSLRIDVV